MSECRLHSQGCADGTFGVVLVGDWGAEEGEDSITEDLVDPAPEGGDVVDEQLKSGVDQPLDGFGIAVLGQCRETDEIGEQHRCDPTFFCLSSGDGIAARRTEPCICGNL